MFLDDPKSADCIKQLEQVLPLRVLILLCSNAISLIEKAILWL